LSGVTFAAGGYMRLPRFNVFMPFFLVILTVVLAVSCSDDDDKAIAPNLEWRWASLGDGFTNTVIALSVYDNKLIAAGSGVSAWNGNTWTSLINSMDGWVHTLTVYDNKLIAAGQFNDIDGVTNTLQIAAWNGTTWMPLGTGMNSQILDLTVWDDKLIACGNFTTAGGVSANHIAAWNGSSWAPLGTGFSVTVSELIVHNGTLYAGADDRLVAWNGISWDSIPNASTFYQGGTTTGLAIYDGKLIRAGAFLHNIGPGYIWIAAWDGTSWDSLGMGTNNLIYDLTVFDNQLVAGGPFTAAGGADTISYIAVWDGESWAPLGTGTNDLVQALTVWNNKLIACGQFTSAGGVSVPGIAAWGLQ